MPKTKSTNKETTKSKTRQKKKTVPAPRKAAATQTAKKTTAAKVAKTSAIKAPKAPKPAVAKKAGTGKGAAAAKAPRTARKAKSTYPDEKRKHLRLHYSRLISFIHYDAKNNIESPGSMGAVRDLSPAGILIETGATFQRGDRLAMDIAFEQDKIIAAEGDVIHVRKTDGVLCKAGIKFTKINKKDLTYLKGFLDGRLAKA